MPSVNADQLRDAAESLVITYPEDLDIRFPEEILHLQKYMSEPELMWQSQKGDDNGTCISLH